MTFKLYSDKNSLDKRYSRFTVGGDTVQIGNFLGWWEKKNIPKNQLDDVKFIITSEFNLRPDKIAKYVYGREDFQWLVLQYNNIVDINEELITGKTIVLPSYQRVMFNIINE